MIYGDSLCASRGREPATAQVSIDFVRVFQRAQTGTRLMVAALPAATPKRTISSRLASSARRRVMRRPCCRRRQRYWLFIGGGTTCTLPLASTPSAPCGPSETTTRRTLPERISSSAARRTSSGWLRSRPPGTQLFWLGLTSSILPTSRAAASASPELSMMQRSP